MDAKPTEVWRAQYVLRILSQAESAEGTGWREWAGGEMPGWMVSHGYLRSLNDAEVGVRLRLTDLGRDYLAELRAQVTSSIVVGVVIDYVISASAFLEPPFPQEPTEQVLATPAELAQVWASWKKKWPDADLDRYLRIESSRGRELINRKDLEHHFPDDYPIGTKMGLLTCGLCRSDLGWKYLHSYPLLNGYTTSSYCDCGDDE